MLPMVETDEEWDAVVPEKTVMRVGAEDLCARLGLAGAPLSRFPDGSQPVYAVGDELVLKLFPAAAAQDGVAEGRVLSHLHGLLPVPTPKAHDFGPYESGWQYVLMSRLPGQNLAHAWDRMARADHERLVADVGETLAVLHALDPAPLADVLGPGDWGAFLDHRRAAAVEQQRGHGLPSAWLDQIPDFLTSVALPHDPQPALLHTEVMRQHFLVDADSRQLTGLLDFEPAMIGHRAYDFVGVGLFVTRGDPHLMARLTTAYGHAFEPDELLASTLPHVYSNPPWYLRELDAPAEGTLTAPAEAWFGTA
ncbi:aminoglycoside 3'-phosphotransferase/choline kinase family protein [Streptomyces sp. NPDC002838]|uniref:phosphotransferase family protein n=1 Tax=Streptomyces sp. NPDC002838 TaxID=3154436 RepID=UPI003334293D